jgi:hypothetical protein
VSQIQNEPLALLPQIHFEHPAVVVVVRDHLQCGRTPHVGTLNGSTARIKLALPEVDREGALERLFSDLASFTADTLIKGVAGMTNDFGSVSD